MHRVNALLYIIRKMKGYSRAAIADILKVNVDTLKSWEVKRNPKVPPHQIPRWAKALDINDTEPVIQLFDRQSISQKLGVPQPVADAVYFFDKLSQQEKDELTTLIQRLTIKHILAMPREMQEATFHYDRLSPKQQERDSRASR